MMSRPSGLLLTWQTQECKRFQKLYCGNEMLSQCITQLFKEIERKVPTFIKWIIVEM